MAGTHKLPAWCVNSIKSTRDMAKVAARTAANARVIESRESLPTRSRLNGLRALGGRPLRCHGERLRAQREIAQRRLERAKPVKSTREEYDVVEPLNLKPSALEQRAYLLHSDASDTIGEPAQGNVQVQIMAREGPGCAGDLASDQSKAVEYSYMRVVYEHRAKSLGPTRRDIAPPVAVNHPDRIRLADVPALQCGNPIARGVQHARSSGCVLPDILAKMEHRDPRSLRGELRQKGRRPVDWIVANEDGFYHPQGQRRGV
jgi:hypothetical protein